MHLSAACSLSWIAHANRAIAWWLRTIVFLQVEPNDDDPVLRSVLLVQHLSSMSKGLAVTSRRLLCALARPPGSCSCWALLRPARGRHEAPAYTRWCGISPVGHHQNAWLLL